MRRRVLVTTLVVTLLGLVIFALVTANVSYRTLIDNTRGIVTAQRSYMGAMNGYSSAVKIKAAPKKFEMVSDKIAVDYMVKAGFNPLGLITLIHKSCPQKRFDRFSNKNLTSKRLAVIYEYIYTKYPYFLANNTYLENEHYQNFLLTSQHNRKLLYEKIKTGSKEELNYE